MGNVSSKYSEQMAGHIALNSTQGHLKHTRHTSCKLHTVSSQCLMNTHVVTSNVQLRSISITYCLGNYQLGHDEGKLDEGNIRSVRMAH